MIHMTSLENKLFLMKKCIKTHAFDIQNTARAQNSWEFFNTF